MVELLQSGWFWGAAQCVAVVASCWLVQRQLKLQRFTHVLGALAELRRRWNDDALVNSRSRVAASFLNDAQYPPREAEEIAGFFEELGYSVEAGALPEDFVWEGYCYPIQCYWTILSAWVRSERERSNDHTVYKWFERLDARMRKLDQRNSLEPGCASSDDELSLFAERETIRTTARKDEIAPLRVAPALAAESEFVGQVASAVVSEPVSDQKAVATSSS